MVIVMVMVIICWYLQLPCFDDGDSNHDRSRYHDRLYFFLYSIAHNLTPLYILHFYSLHKFKSSVSDPRAGRDGRNRDDQDGSSELDGYPYRGGLTAPKVQYTTVWHNADSSLYVYC